MVLNKKNFNAVVVVEGKDDTIRLKQFFPGIIIFTDPDFNGERIRRIVSQAVPKAKQAFITRKEGEPEKRGNSLGVEHASKEALERALTDLHEVELKKTDLSYDLYRSLGLAAGTNSKGLREKVGAILSIGYGNAKSFFNRLNTFGITSAELKQAVEEAKDGK